MTRTLKAALTLTHTGTEALVYLNRTEEAAWAYRSGVAFAGGRRDDWASSHRGAHSALEGCQQFDAWMAEYGCPGRNAGQSCECFALDPCDLGHKACEDHLHSTAYHTADCACGRTEADCLFE